MKPKEIAKFLIRDKFDPSLSVAKWFNSILIFSSVYFLLNLIVGASFSFSGSVLSVGEGLILFTSHVIIMLLFLLIILEGFFSKVSPLRWIGISILMITSWFVQSVALFLIVTHDIVSINLKQQLISEDMLLSSDFDDKFVYLTAAMDHSKGLYLVLIGSFLFNGVLSIYPLFTLLQFRLSGRRYYFLRYLKIRKRIYNAE